MTKVDIMQSVDARAEHQHGSLHSAVNLAVNLEVDLADGFSDFPTVTRLEFTKTRRGKITEVRWVKPPQGLARASSVDCGAGHREGGRVDRQKPSSHPVVFSAWSAEEAGQNAPTVPAGSPSHKRSSSGVAVRRMLSGVLDRKKWWASTGHEPQQEAWTSVSPSVAVRTLAHLSQGFLPHQRQTPLQELYIG